jgi:hypothetical protein
VRGEESIDPVITNSIVWICGFRVLSGLIGDSVDSYNMVRLDLSIELKQNKKKIFRGVC